MNFASAYDTTSGAIDGLVWVFSYAILAGIVWVVVKAFKSWKPTRSSPKTTSIIIGRPDYKLKLNSDTKDFLDSLEHVDGRQDGWYKDPAGAADLRYHYGGRWTPATASDSFSKEEKSAAIEAVLNNDFLGSQNGSNLELFLNGFPDPLISNDGITKLVKQVDDFGSWLPDPLGRWSKRFNQGSIGSVGWTNRVADFQGVESRDNLTFEELTSLDKTHPNTPEPLPMESNTQSAGWFTDPTGFFSERFWSGKSWTVNVKDKQGFEFAWMHTSPPEISIDHSTAPSNAPFDERGALDSKTITQPGLEELSSTITPQNVAAELATLSELFSKGHLSEDEFNRAKKRTLG
jgi:hypothetical protein